MTNGEDASPETTSIPVLIVGGGPVGLALAVDLGWRGIACELIEQGDGSIAIPKMNEVNVRTMEFCRRWGVADEVLNCPFPADYPLDIVFVTNLFGYELGRMPRPARSGQRPEPYSPMRLQACSQLWFDPILQRRARSFAHVRLRYRHELQSFEQSDTSVAATVIDHASGERRRINAQYLVGCDGAGSMVRGALGIGLTGEGTIGSPVHMFFRAPKLLEICGKQPGTFFLPVDRGGMWGNIRIIDPVNAVWRLMVDHVEGASRADAIDREAHLYRALGRTLEVEWLGVSIWRRRSVVAEHYGDGRVFLAGDAVHQLSPTGALGMNTGIADAVDLGWKLAATLQSWGGAGLLASYERERRPIGERNVRMATGFHRNNAAVAADGAIFDDPGEEGARRRQRLGEMLVRDIAREFRTVGLQLGYRYEDSPICVPDGAPAPADDPESYQPSTRPGARAPHVWLRDGRSTLDLFGRDFVLLKFSDSPEATAIEAAAMARSVPLTTVELDEPEAAALYERKLTLVRPDGHVAWRADRLPDDALSLVDRVRGVS